MCFLPKYKKSKISTYLMINGVQLSLKFWLSGIRGKGTTNCQARNRIWLQDILKPAAEGTSRPNSSSWLSTCSWRSSKRNWWRHAPPLIKTHEEVPPPLESNEENVARILLEASSFHVDDVTVDVNVMGVWPRLTSSCSCRGYKYPCHGL